MKIFQFLTFVLMANLLFSCKMEGQNWSATGIKGEGPKVTKTLDLSSFDGFGLSINATVYLTQGSTQSVKVEAQQNILDNLVTKVENNYWKIKFDKNVRNNDGVKIWITIPDLKKASVSGSGDIVGESAFKNLGDLSLAISGSGSINLDSDSKSLDVSVSGSGDMKLAGNTGNYSIQISGSGDVVSEDLQAQTCSVKISGSGDASVHVSNELDVAIAGSGDVIYRGSPKVKSKISGSGDVMSK